MVPLPSWATRSTTKAPRKLHHESPTTKAQPTLRLLEGFCDSIRRFPFRREWFHSYSELAAIYNSDLPVRRVPGLRLWVQRPPEARRPLGILTPYAVPYTDLATAKGFPHSSTRYRILGSSRKPPDAHRVRSGMQDRLHPPISGQVLA